MAREKFGYRDNLERLNEYFPYEMLTIKDIMQFTGLSRHTVERQYPYKGKYISKANFARMITTEF